MAKGKKIDKLIEQLIANQLETHLTRLVRKSKKRAEREKAKLNQFLQLEYTKDAGFVEAEYEEAQPSEEEKSIKGNIQ